MVLRCGLDEVGGPTLPEVADEVLQQAGLDGVDGEMIMCTSVLDQVGSEPALGQPAAAVMSVPGRARGSSKGIAIAISMGGRGEAIAR